MNTTLNRGSILTECAAIVAAALLLGTLVHHFRTDAKKKIAWVGSYGDACLKIRKPTTPPPPASAQPSPPPATPPAGPVREILADEALRHHQDGTLFLDARRTRFHESEHIPGARPFSVWETDLDRKISALLEEIPLEIPLVIYCQSGDCEDSHQLADKLKLAGYKEILVFRGGFPEWKKREWPVEAGAGAPGEAGGEPPPEEAKQ
ncbi:MAG: rhodanese-like domain-containing protein [Candidatus Methylomirabilales bacterium]